MAGRRVRPRRGRARHFGGTLLPGILGVVVVMSGYATRTIRATLAPALTSSPIRGPAVSLVQKMKGTSILVDFLYSG